MSNIEFVGLVVQGAVAVLKRRASDAVPWAH